MSEELQRTLYVDAVLQHAAANGGAHAFLFRCAKTNERFMVPLDELAPCKSSPPLTTPVVKTVLELKQGFERLASYVSLPVVSGRFTPLASK
jgi:hypothetical protein